LTDVTNILIKAGADVNAKDQNGITPLQIAIIESKFEIAKLLVEAGADVNAKDQNGITPLNIAKIHDPDYNQLTDILASKIGSDAKTRLEFIKGTLRKKSNLSLIGDEKGLIDEILGKTLQLKLSDIPEEDRNEVKTKIEKLQKIVSEKPSPIEQRFTKMVKNNRDNNSSKDRTL